MQSISQNYKLFGLAFYARLFLLLLIFAFTGCDSKIYTNIHDKNKIGLSFKKLEIIANDKFSKDSATAIIKKKGFNIEKSSYKLRVEHRDYTKACTNPLSKTSSDYSYDGLVVAELFYEDKKIYTVYMDYKGEKSEKLFASLIQKMFDDMKIEKIN